MRIVSWNITNLAPWFDRAAELAALVERLGAPDVLCLQEVRIRASDTAAAERARSLLPDYHGELALANDPRNVTFRGGRAYGVATYVKREHRSLAAPAEWDREGRVMVTALPDRGLAIVNLYAVNGTSKPYVDPDTGARSGDRHTFKRTFQTRILDLAAELRATSRVVLAGDWNVSRAAIDVTPRLRTEAPHALARAQLNERLAADDWHDPLRERSPDARTYTWFGKTRAGTLDAARVDYFIVSDPDVADVGVLDERPGSDHAPLFLEL